MTTPADRTAILIVRLWIEDDPRSGFRARITQTLDSLNADQTVSTAGGPDAVYGAVKGWVEAFVAQASA